MDFPCSGSREHVNWNTVHARSSLLTNWLSESGVLTSETCKICRTGMREDWDWEPLGYMCHSLVRKLYRSESDVTCGQVMGSGQGRRYGFWAPWTAYSLGPSCRGGGLVFPLHTDHVTVEIAIAFSAEPCTRASNLGPGPRRSGPSPARVRQLNRITFFLFFFVPSPKSDYTVSAIKIVRFCM